MVLKGAAMAGVRILIQSGWGNIITNEEFYQYAKEASDYAKIASDDLIGQDLIFPGLERSASESSFTSASTLWAVIAVSILLPFILFSFEII